MMRIVTMIGGALALAGCAAPAPELPPSPPTVVVAPQAPQPVDECRAGDFQHLVGQPRTQIPVPVNPALQRVACTTCAITMDFHPRRLNFFFDASTGIVREVRCG